VQATVRGMNSNIRRLGVRRTRNTMGDGGEPNRKKRTINLLGGSPQFPTPEAECCARRGNWKGTGDPTTRRGRKEKGQMPQT